MRASPVPPSERLIELDVLRGFALLGIPVMNWTLDWQPISQPWNVSGLADQMTAWFVWIFAANKFWTIFSFLFAVGFTIQVQRLRARNANVISIYSRRLIILFLFGAANFIFGPADVIYVYAMLGFVLLIMERRPPTGILPVFAITIMLLLWSYDVWTGRDIPTDATASAAHVEASEMDELWNEWQQVRSSGSFKEVTIVRAQLFWKWSLRRWQWFLNFLPIFLIGLYVGRKGIFHDIEGNLPLIRNGTKWALLTSVLCLLLSAGSYSFPELSYLTSKIMELLWKFSILFLGLTYIGCIVLLLQIPGWADRLWPLANVGRLALTNFLLLSVVFVPINLGYGLGLRGQIGVAGWLLIALLFFLFQLVFSTWWLKRYRFGPAEWLWRTLTYGRLPPMKQTSES